MAPASALVGPPVAVAFNADPKPQPKPTIGSSPDYSSDENSSMDEDSTEKKVVSRSAQPLAYASSGDPCVDFFFQVVPGVTSDADLAALLDVAWSQDALTALKLVCHLRGVRGLGKSDRDGFYAAALWMHARHPLTLAANLANLARFGCLKDLPEILYLVLHGPREEDQRKGDGRRRRTKRRRGVDEAKAAKERLNKEAQLAQAALARYASDEAFRHLYDRVADTFAELLKSDVEHLRAGDTSKIGLAAKWCPSLRSSYDRATLLCEAIARRVFPRESNKEYLDLSDKHYTYRVRNLLRREVLVPLRKVLELPEVYMSAGQWDELPYARVASVAMNKYKEVFQKRDKPRVVGFFDDVRTGHARVAAGAVLPHELIAAALKGEHDEAADLQWRSMVSALAAEGRLDNCIAVCGLTGAATDPAVSAAVALGLLISELSQEPWKGRVITFDETHQLHKLHGGNLKEKLQPLVAALGPRKKGANLQGVFSKILSTAVAGGLRRDMMVKRVFVLSDMDFDGWAGPASAWDTEYQGISNRFSDEGFAAPEVVFWNLGTSKSSMPVVAAQEGAALVSGYSKNLVRLFLEADGNLTPAAVMADAISGPEYDALEVFD
ncbi:hypothetical protein SEVIR_5G377500v4 [Setaria viridis]|uniref:TROVE domain-containing protein n=1 Tax=Setaria viridis TaxID=4556 RepID=A0A4U6USL7_SETVI|nr:hypothetical protein SEVIR_5G377500v2 [Setaria viridis]